MADVAGNILLLVTGATGYIGGRLVPRLLQAGYRVRCFVRDPERLQGRPWLAQVEVVAGDILQAETLSAAMTGVSVAYYLIHSMAGGQGFHERDLISARNFGAAAAAAGVGRIIYLGGLGDSAAELSQHLRSRQDTGDALREEQGAGHGVSRRRHCRFGQPVVRADSLPDRTSTGHTLPVLGLHLHPTHWRAQCPGVSDCRAGDAGQRRGDHRDRWRRCADLR